MTDKQRQVHFEELQEAILADPASVPGDDLIEFCHIGDGIYFPRFVARSAEEQQARRDTGHVSVEPAEAEATQR